MICRAHFNRTEKIKNAVTKVTAFFIGILMVHKTIIAEGYLPQGLLGSCEGAALLVPDLEPESRF